MPPTPCQSSQKESDHLSHCQEYLGHQQMKSRLQISCRRRIDNSQALRIEACLTKHDGAMTLWLNLFYVSLNPLRKSLPNCVIVD